MKDKRCFCYHQKIIQSQKVGQKYYGNRKYAKRVELKMYILLSTSILSIIQKLFSFRSAQTIPRRNTKNSKDNNKTVLHNKM